MKQNLIAVNTQGMSFDEAMLFAHNYERIGGATGPGSNNHFSRWLGIGAMDGLTLILGVPASQLHTKHVRAAEAIYEDTYGHTDNIWGEPTWNYTNPNSCKLDLSDCTLDLDYIESFGFKQPAWEKHVFHTSGLFNRIRTDMLVDDQKYRAKIALRVFGFPDAQQFFTVET